MPIAIPTPRSSSTSSRSSNNESPHHETAPSSAGASVIEGDEYPTHPFPGYDEAPLEEGLEPIAVVGMGKS